MFHLLLQLLYGLTTLEEDAVGPLEKTWVLAQDLIRVIFEDMDPIWLCSMWEAGGSACADMIDILISLALLKLSSRL
jgi:hypothetical protein